ncbi:NAD(P)-dependent oxidoreductase [Arthrobacter sp. 35W]|uniref:NAD(P)-dependent oxidoreductase n=1 Tax=Arthrobacter sp. 35W TaxID=1132441 RepID=UPI0004211601|nr:NAD(P)-dependent oxidoreductase [Arthrobacter sp. 35W]
MTGLEPDATHRSTVPPAAQAAGRQVGFVGLGLMGAPMAANLLRAGWPVTAWNRSTAALDALEADGGTRTDSVAGLRDASTIIFMLPDLSDIEAAAAPLLDSWAASPPASGTAVVVMSSVSPVRVRGFGEAVSLASAGRAAVVDAPVSGGTIGAQQGTLAIMVGADEAAFTRLRPLFDAMGSTVRRLGPLGSGSLAKACNQLIVGTTTAALAEAAELAERSGMDAGALFEVLAGGLAGSRVLEVAGPRLVAKDYAPTGPAKFMKKDLAFVLDSAASAGSAVPLATAAYGIYDTLVEQGLGAQDLAVVRESISRRSAATQALH